LTLIGVARPLSPNEHCRSDAESGLIQNSVVDFESRKTGGDEDEKTSRYDGTGGRKDVTAALEVRGEGEVDGDEVKDGRHDEEEEDCRRRVKVGREREAEEQGEEGEHSREQGGDLQRESSAGSKA
jgi:hypothetical protein